MNALALLIALALPPQRAEAPPAAAPRIDQVAVRVRSRAELERLARLASDVDDHRGVRDGRVVIHADADEQERLARLGFELEVRRRDLAGFYARRAARSAAAGVDGAGSMGGFRTLAEIEAFLDALAASHPAIVSPKFSIGTSHEGRTIWAVRISDDPANDDPTEPVAWYDALHHAREVMSAESLLLFMQWLCDGYATDAVVQRIVDSRNLLVVPCVNPDGNVYNQITDPGGGGLWRKNRRDNGGGTFGVDLNRNWGWEWGPQWPGSSGSPFSTTYRGPSAFSEPETQALRDFFALHPAGMAISVHAYGDVWIHPWGYDDVVTPEHARFAYYAAAMTAANGWLYGTVFQTLGYVANGGTFDWLYGTHGTFAYSPEVGGDEDGFWPDPADIPELFEDVRPAYVLAARWSGGWADVQDVVQAEVQGDGDPWPEANELWRIELVAVNRGVLPVDAELTLSSTTADIEVVGPTARLLVPAGSMAPLPLAATVGPMIATVQPLGPLVDAAARIATPGLWLRVAADAAPGVHELVVTVDYDGVATDLPVAFRVGEQRLLAIDDLETGVPGWQVTNAVTGTWQRAAPQPTTSSGEPVQPGQDDPLTSGTLCWVTDPVAGLSATQRDVDGTTVLVSPRFDASPFGHVRLGYARWFASAPGGPRDDRLVVEISNDDGAGWTELERVEHDSAWRDVAFDLEAALPLTSAMRLRFTVADDPDDDVTEACIDSIRLSTAGAAPTLGLWGDAAQGATPRLLAAGAGSVACTIRWSTELGAGTSVPGIAGLSWLAGSVQDLYVGSTDAKGHAAVDWTVPAGTVIHLQALLDEGNAGAAWTNPLSVTVR
jgi:hypothetical protein